MGCKGVHVVPGGDAPEMNCVIVWILWNHLPQNRFNVKLFAASVFLLNR